MDAEPPAADLIRANLADLQSKGYRVEAVVNIHDSHAPFTDSRNNVYRISEEYDGEFLLAFDDINIQIYHNFGEEFDVRYILGAGPVPENDPHSVDYPTAISQPCDLLYNPNYVAFVSLNKVYLT